MKNIHELLAEHGLSIAEDKKAEFDKALSEQYKTVAEMEKRESKITALQEQLDAATEGLKAFDGVDVNELKGQISKLQGELSDKDAQYQGKLADMEFGGLLDSAIAAAKGKNAKAVKGLLDLDTLKASKNQSEDIKAALEGLKATDDYLFESAQTPPPYAAGTGTTPITPPTLRDQIMKNAKDAMGIQ